ncbi:hypothetical protein HDE_08882 [Halotydeus destructor]|nr:hypothetical protein HDE_08882 [Halotydeus destructor]
MFQALSLAGFRFALGLFTGKCLALNLVAVPALRAMDNPARPFKTFFQRNLGLCTLLILFSVVCGLVNWRSTHDNLALICACLHALCFPIGMSLQPDVRKYVDIEDIVPGVEHQEGQGQGQGNQAQTTSNGSAPRTPDIGPQQVKKDIERWSLAHWIEAGLAGSALWLALFCLPGNA